MTQVPYTLRVLAGETETRYGERLYHSGAVHIVEKSAKRLSCKVADGEMYDVVFTDDGESRCSCPIYVEAGACRHVVAAMIKCQDEGAMGDMVRRKAEAAGPKLMAAMDRALPEEGADGAVPAAPPDGDGEKEAVCAQENGPQGKEERNDETN